MAVTIAYLVHDLGDAAVARRVASIGEGGAKVQLAGFFRRPPPADVAGVPALPLGQTEDGRLMQRALLVLMILLAPGRLSPVLQGATVIMARNIEMLLIAVRVRHQNQRLVYECLDIHRIMLRRSVSGSVMRALERLLLAHVNQVIVSSPAFERDYFRERQQYIGPVDLVENKVPASPVIPVPVILDRPWTIGWFGMLRCRRSLALLAQLAAGSGGRVKILIAGIPSVSEFPDFEGQVALMEGVEYVGRYRPADLSSLYSRVHFAWCIDYFEEGLNSRWLLPNRLYESIAHGAVPVALAEVETGRWLTEAGVGLTLPIGHALAHLLATMTERQHYALREQVAALPKSKIAFTPYDHQRIVARLVGSTIV